MMATDPMKEAKRVWLMAAWSIRHSQLRCGFWQVPAAARPGRASAWHPVYAAEAQGLITVDWSARLNPVLGNEHLGLRPLQLPYYCYC